jgi:hypothetical protein
MANPQSESPLRRAFPFLSLRGASINRGDEAISMDSPRGREQCLARAKRLTVLPRPDIIGERTKVRVKRAA